MQLDICPISSVIRPISHNLRPKISGEAGQKVEMTAIVHTLNPE
jgi:hypothetical protein